MARVPKRTVRVAAIAVVVVCAATLGYGFVTAATGTGDDVAERARTTDARDAGTATTPGTGTNATKQGNETKVTVPDGEVTGGSLDGKQITVIATQGFYVSEERAEILAVDRTGEVVYFDDDYRVYFDVDPVAGTRYTVEYLAAAHYNGSVCEPFRSQRCTNNVVERVNLSTGETTTVYERLTPRIYSARWHDVDRVNETHLVVADIVYDRVYTVDTRTGEITWQWNASEHYDADAGGKAGDWTHVNDVEVLPDGRIMTSLRNMDEVVFLDPGEGVDENWTLGQDDDHSVLFEQHNPDYITAENGGPAVIVADSENNRVVEYRRSAGNWTRTWTWRDARLQWPRDADRLPNGKTLVVDTHGDRVLEIGPRDRVVWSVSVGMPYDVERLGTGDESAGGPTADRRLAAWRNATADGSGGDASSPTDGGDGGESVLSRVDRAAAGLWLTLKTLAPAVAVNGLLYVSPQWVHFSDLGFAFVLVATLLVWGSAEFYWSSYSIRGFGRWVRERVASVG